MAVVGTLSTEMEQTIILIDNINKLQPPFMKNNDQFISNWEHQVDHLLLIINNIKSAYHTIVNNNNDEKFRSHLYKINRILMNIQQTLEKNSKSDNFISKNSLNDIFSSLSSLKKSVDELSIFYLLSCPNFSSNISQNVNDLMSLEKAIKQTKDLASGDLKTVSDKIKETNELVSKSALGESFRTRYKYLNRLSWFWFLLVVVSIGLLIDNSVNLSTNIPDLNYDYNKLNFIIYKSILEIPKFVAILWALWFTCKQYMESRRLCDDYHFKYDLSNAFYGYNEQIKNLATDDTIMQLALLDLVLKNIGNNPVKDANDDNCNSPYSEIISKTTTPIQKMGEIIDKIKGKASVE